MRAGLPTTVAKSGTFFSTTAAAPTVAQFPILIFGSTMAPAPKSVGSRSTSQYGMESQEIGIKPSQRVKLFISSTTIDSTDMFGNTELLNGEKIKVHANYVDAHTGLMLAAMNQTFAYESCYFRYL